MIGVNKSELTIRVDEYVRKSEDEFRIQMESQLNQVLAEREEALIEKIKKSLYEDRTS